MSGFTALVVLFCYTAIVVKVNISKKVRTTSQDSKENKKKSEEWKLTLQFAIVFLVYILLVLTYFITFGLELSGYVISNGLLAWIGLLIWAHPTVNPYIYLFFNSKLRVKTFSVFGKQYVGDMSTTMKDKSTAHPQNTQHVTHG